MLLAGGAGLLVANVQSGNLIEEYYKKQVPVVTAFDCSAERSEAAEASCCLHGDRLCSGLLRAFALSPSLLGPVMCLATPPSRIWTVYSCKTSLPSSTMLSLEPTVRLATLLAPHSLYMIKLIAMQKCFCSAVQLLLQSGPCERHAACTVCLGSLYCRLGMYCYHLKT